ncbi:MAG: hypothetical protein KDC92_17520 [Bacteroidetes bacterium]|nr:hypothetical protein [Bacteroidota bacterium]
MNLKEHNQAIVAKINAELPSNAMFDGFWIHKYKNQNLCISCSQNRFYYRQFDIIFKKVRFFNLPAEWQSGHMRKIEPIRMATLEEFKQQQPDFNVANNAIFAIDLSFNYEQLKGHYTYFVVAEKLIFFKCADNDSSVGLHYTDKFSNEGLTCLKNRAT